MLQVANRIAAPDRPRSAVDGIRRDHPAGPGDRPSSIRHRAFTLVEMMVSMALTLLLMAALARAFGQLGQDVRTSRVQVDLSSRVRDVTHRIREELSRCTVTPTAATRVPEEGYLVYYDGPISNISGALFGQSPNVDNENTLQDSRYGDFDDYLAFTAAAPEGAPFTGKVPRYLLDLQTWLAAAGGNTVANFDPTQFPGDPLDPVVITSQYAEIIYFLSPTYQTSADTGNASRLIHVHDANGDPMIQDITGTGMPTGLKLHRRVLLIRPDLNINNVLQAYTRNGYTYMEPDLWSVDTTTADPAIKTPGGNGLTVTQSNRAWLIGMAPVHQQCDLSVRRLLDLDGRPLPIVAANSLADLAIPHNRFAHVRIPQNFLNIPAPSGTFGYTSMPVLAMGSMSPILQRAATASVRSVPPLGGSPAVTPAIPVVTPTFMNGFLRPEFILGQDHTHTDLFGDGWGIERIGEDVLMTGVLGFDVQGFDADVQTYILPGRDLRYGIAGVDDDGNGIVDDPLSGLENNEAGYVGSDDRVVSPNDPAYVDAILKLNTANLVGGEQPPVPGVRGSFVDLGYDVQAGGALRGNEAMGRDFHTAALPGGMRPYLGVTPLPSTQLSTWPMVFNAMNRQYRPELFRSGRVITNAGNRLLLYQPVFDTFTSFYERDGFLQSPADTGNGNLWWLRSGTGGQITYLPGGAGGVDAGTDGLDNINTFDANTILRSGYGASGGDETETRPPMQIDLPALKITLRIENTQVREVEQSSIAHYFESR